MARDPVVLLLGFAALGACTTAYLAIRYWPLALACAGLVAAVYLPVETGAAAVAGGGCYAAFRVLRWLTATQARAMLVIATLAACLLLALNSAREDQRLVVGRHRDPLAQK